MSEEETQEETLEPATKRTYKIVSAPEGNPTFVDESSGVERPYLRIHEVREYSEKAARRIVDFSNWDIHVQYESPLYEITSVEDVTEEVLEEVV
jgi:hypothetical protein